LAAVCAVFFFFLFSVVVYFFSPISGWSMSPDIADVYSMINNEIKDVNLHVVGGCCDWECRWSPFSAHFFFFFFFFFFPSIFATIFFFSSPLVQSSSPRHANH
jgi:hypothetical protein